MSPCLRFSVSAFSRGGKEKKSSLWISRRDHSSNNNVERKETAAGSGFRVFVDNKRSETTDCQRSCAIDRSGVSGSRRKFKERVEDLGEEWSQKSKNYK